MLRGVLLPLDVDTVLRCYDSSVRLREPTLCWCVVGVRAMHAAPRGPPPLRAAVRQLRSPVLPPARIAPRWRLLGRLGPAPTMTGERAIPIAAL